MQIKLSPMVDAAATMATNSMLSKGNCFPQVAFQPGPSLSRPGYCNIMAWSSVSRLVEFCVHHQLIKMGYKSGAASRKSARLIADLKTIISGMTAVHSADLKVGMKVLMPNVDNPEFPLNCLIAERGIDRDNGIMTVDIDDGPYSETDTDVYIHDIMAVEVDGLWCPIDLLPDEREFKRQVARARAGM
jgi:hypothetical protein